MGHCSSISPLHSKPEAARSPAAGSAPAPARNSPARRGRGACVAQPVATLRGPLTAMMGEETFHPDTRALLAYGRALAGAGASPKKGGADKVLERLFVIERTRDGRLPVRTFGKDLIQLFGRDLRDHDFARLFLEADARLMHALVDAAAAAGEPAIARISAESADRRKLAAEVLITPLKVDAMLGERFLGLFQSLGGEPFLDGKPLLRLRVGSLHPPAAKEPQGMRLVVSND